MTLIRTTTIESPRGALNLPLRPELSSRTLHFDFRAPPRDPNACTRVAQRRALVGIKAVTVTLALVVAIVGAVTSGPMVRRTGPPPPLPGIAFPITVDGGTAHHLVAAHGIEKALLRALGPLAH